MNCGLCVVVCLLAGVVAADAAPRAPQQRAAAGFWMQLAVAPPGTNPTQIIETVTPPPTTNPTPTPTPTPGTPTSPGAVPTGVVQGIAVPLGVPSGAVPSGTSPVSSTGASAPGRVNMPGPTGSMGTAPGRVGGTPATQSVPALPPNCKVAFGTPGQEVAALGGTVELTPVFTPATCRTAPQAMASWIQPVAGSGQDGVFRFSIAANLTTAPREGVVALGPQRFVLRQSPGRKALYAVAPGSLTLSMKRKKAPKPAVFAVWSEEADLTYSVLGSADQWLAVRELPVKKGEGTRRFEVNVKPETLAPGRHEAVVRIAASGVVNAPLAIPIVVDVR